MFLLNRKSKSAHGYWLVCGHGQAKDELSMRRCWPVSSFDSAYKVEAGAKAATASEAAIELFHHDWVAKRLVHYLFMLFQRGSRARVHICVCHTSI